jgi:YhcH/YjgK/YiaL family protein
MVRAANRDFLAKPPADLHQGFASGFSFAFNARMPALACMFKGSPQGSHLPDLRMCRVGSLSPLMILDQLSASGAYESLHPLFAKAFAYLRAFDGSVADGGYELEGRDLVAMVQRYHTASSAEKLWESHRVYGDIQFVFAGVEYCGHADRGSLAITQAYKPEKDVEKYAAPDVPSALLTLGRGNFAIFHPQDAHQPGVQIGAPAEIVKVVIKFRLTR